MAANNSGKHWSYGEIALTEGVLMLVLWLWNDYAAALITLSIAVIVSAVLLLALVAEWIEPSRVPKRYFWVALVLVGVALGIGLLYTILAGGRLDFLEHK